VDPPVAPGCGAFWSSSPPQLPGDDRAGAVVIRFPTERPDVPRRQPFQNSGSATIACIAGGRVQRLRHTLAPAYCGSGQIRLIATILVHALNINRFSGYGDKPASRMVSSRRQGGVRGTSRRCSVFLHPAKSWVPAERLQVAHVQELPRGAVRLLVSDTMSPSKPVMSAIHSASSPMEMSRPLPTLIHAGSS
jgi:hypothetical protein